MESMGRREDLECLVLPDLQDSLDLEDSLGLMETSDLRDQRAFMDSLDKLEQRVTLEARETRGLKAPGDSQAPQEILAREVPWESEVKLDLRVPMESLEHQVVEECLDLMGQWDPKASQEIKVFKDCLVLRVNLGTLEDQEPLDCKVYEEHLAGEAQEEQGDPWENLETTGKMGRQGSLVCRVSLGGQDLWGLRETRVSLETRGLRDRQEFQDPRVNGEILARMEKLGGEALQDLMDLLERMAPLAVQDLGASRACLDLEAKTDLPVLMVALGCRELWV
jgi:hypothetical protein